MKSKIASLMVAAALVGGLVQAAESKGSANSESLQTQQLAQTMVIQEQLAQLHEDLKGPKAHAFGSQGCIYAGQFYTSGAYIQQGAVTLVCVDRTWGMIQSDKTDFVWEPLQSKRLSDYRRAIGLDAK